MGDMGLQGAVANDSLQQLLSARRAQALAQQQQAFENSLKTRTLDQQDTLTRLKIQEMAQAASERAAAMQGQAQDRQIGMANTLDEQMPPGFYPDTPDVQKTVGMLRTGGRGYAMTPTPARPAMGPDFQGPMPGDETPQEAQVGRSAGFLKSATAKQQETEADRLRKEDAANSGLDVKRQQIEQASQMLGLRGDLIRAQTEAANARAEADRNKTNQPAKLPQREDNTVVSIHQMMPLVDELLQKTQARLASKPQRGLLGSLPEKAGRLITKAEYSAGLPVQPADSERIQLASLLQILGTVPYLRGIRNMQFVNQIQQHLADPSATDESLVERLTKLKQILPGMEQAIYDVHNGGVIPHAHTGAMDTSKPNAADLIKKYGG